MTTIATACPTIQRPEPEYLADDAQLAAVAFLARYSGRTLQAYSGFGARFSQPRSLQRAPSDGPWSRAVPALPAGCGAPRRPAQPGC